MSIPLLGTKLYKPPFREPNVSRSILIDRLEVGFQRKLTLISAPAGYGKSTLLSEWAHQTSVPVAWLSLDKGDNLRSRFWAYFRAALQTINSIAGSTIGDSLLGSLESPTLLPIEDTFISLINDLTDLPERIAIVLDDLQMVTDSQVHYDLVYLLENLPDSQGGLHILVASRVDPPWPLARFRVRQDLTELREVDLRFSRDEVDQFLNQTMRLELSQDDVSLLDAKTEGWIAGLQMAAISLNRRQQMLGEAGVSGFIDGFTGSHQFVLDYLVEEVLNQQPPEVQEFLMDTSILERMNASLCDVVTRRDGSQTILNGLDKSNIFLIPLDNNRHWYRYHHLFGDLLLNKLKTSRADSLSGLHLRASQWFEMHDLLDEAVYHALAAEDFARAAHLIEEHGMQMIIKSDLVTLNRWLNALPEEQIVMRPWLCIFHAWARYYVGPREGVEDRLRDAERALDSSGTTTEPGTIPVSTSPISPQKVRHIRGHIAALRAYLELQRGDLENVSELAHQALEDLPEGDYARATSAIALAETFRASGDLQGWYQAYDTAKSIALECDNLPMAVSAATYMADQLSKGGKLQAAYESYQDALRLAVGPGGEQIPAAGLPYVKLGDLHREWNNLTSAHENLTKGIKLCQQWGHSDSLVIGYVALSRVQLADKNFDKAIETYQKAEQLVRQTEVDPWAITLTDDCRLRLWLEKEDISAASHWAAETGLSIGDEPNFYRDLEHINLARVLVAQGAQNPDGPHLNDALHLLERLLKKADYVGWISKSIAVLCLQALAFYSLEQIDQALIPLERALTIGMPGGYVRIFIDEGRPMSQLLYEASARGITPEYVGQLLAAFVDQAAEHETGKRKQHPGMVEPLTNREIEVLKLIAQGLTNREIGDQLSISLGTVKRHTANINGKLDVHNRTQAAARARALGIL